MEALIHHFIQGNEKYWPWKFHLHLI